MKKYLAATYVALLLVLALSPAQGATAKHHHGDALFGVNEGATAQALAEATGLKSERIYANSAGMALDANGVPLTWASVTVPGMTGIFSFKPDLRKVDSGALDASIVTSLRKLPAGSWVTDWHEANLPGHKPPWFTRDLYVASVRHISGLVAKYNIPVRFGQIFGTYQVNKGEDLRPWVVPGLSFYSLDGYQASVGTTPAAVFAKAFTYILDVYPSAALGVAETNSKLGTVAASNAWDLAAWRYTCSAWHVGAYAIFSGTSSEKLPSAPVMQELASLTAQNTC